MEDDIKTEGEQTRRRKEDSLLVYFEKCEVDRAGLVVGRRMNKDDHDIATMWNETGFVAFGRLSARTVQDSYYKSHGLTHWVELSEKAWTQAHQIRRARAVTSRDNAALRLRRVGGTMVEWGSHEGKYRRQTRWQR